MDKMVNVVIEDGNRIVNWDFAPSETVLSVLKRWGFEWEKNSVIVCGTQIADSMLDRPLSDFMYASSKIYRYTERVFIKMSRPIKEQKESDANVC